MAKKKKTAEKKDLIGSAWDKFLVLQDQLNAKFHREGKVPRDILEEVLEDIAKRIIPNETTLASPYGYGCGYTPVNDSLTKWDTTDHGILDTSLLDILINYLDDYKDIADALWSEDALYIIHHYLQGFIPDQQAQEMRQF